MRLHDGFFLRFTLGMGQSRTQIVADSAGAEWTLTGSGFCGGIAVGAAIAPGFVIGGRAEVTQVRTLGVEGPENALGWSDLSYTTLQAFADYYPMPAKGVHFHAGAGPALVSVVQLYSSSTGIQEKQSGSSGPGLTVGGGWEGWVGTQWGLGAMLNLSWAWMNDDLQVTQLNAQGVQTNYVDKVSLKVFSPSVLITATYN